MFKEREPIKTKGAEEWQQEERIHDFFIKTIRLLKRNGVEK